MTAPLRTLPGQLLHLSKHLPGHRLLVPPVCRHVRATKASNSQLLRRSLPEAALGLSSCSHPFTKFHFLLFVLLLQFLQAGRLLWGWKGQH